jgi:hypothetical protein
MIFLPRDYSCGKANPQAPIRMEKYIFEHVMEWFCISILHIGEVFGKKEFLIDYGKL